jgi:hypothetical protein
LFEEDRGGYRGRVSEQGPIMPEYGKFGSLAVRETKKKRMLARSATATAATATAAAAVAGYLCIQFIFSNIVSSISRFRGYTEAYRDAYRDAYDHIRLDK